jgi:hypothetical protein
VLLLGLQLDLRAGMFLGSVLIAAGSLLNSVPAGTVFEPASQPKHTNIIDSGAR